MAARDGEFCDFKPIARKVLKEAKYLIRELTSAIKDLNDTEHLMTLLDDYDKRLRALLPDISLQIEALQKAEQ